MFGEETKDHPTNFSAPFFTWVLVAAAGAFALYRVDRHLYGDREVHPVAEFLGRFKENPDEAEKSHRTWLEAIQKSANDTLIMKADVKRPQDEIVRLKSDACFYRKSDWLVRPGEHYDATAIEIKRSWHDDDKYFGVPYPDKA